LLKEVYNGVNFLFAFHICGTKNQSNNMKQKFLLSLVFACTFIVSAHAQIKKGGTWLGGSIGYSEQKSDYDGSTSDTKSRTVVISPAIGKVVKDNLVVGISLSYYNSKTENNSSSTIDQKGKSYGGGVFVRQYVPIINRLYIFGQGNANFFSTRINETQLDYYGTRTKYKTNGWNSSLGITPGVAVSLTKNLLMETGFNNLLYVSYGKNKRSLDSPSAPKTTNSAFSAGVSLENQSSLYLGFRWLINNKG
jgi:hypothetical protein